MTLLLNREQLMEKLFFNEYTPMNSYFPGGVYENPNNPKNTYDPAAAVKLLAEAGWSTRDAQGRLTKNGRPFEVEYLYGDKGSERWLTIYQEDLRRAGITLNLRLTSYETLLQLQGEHKFDLVSVGWVQGTFPNPEALYHSRFADQQNTFNYVGFKNARVDALLDAYQKEFDQQKRIQMIREIDGILGDSYVYILEWEAPFERLLYLNKFGHPDSYFSRIGSYRDMTSLWWIDPAKEAKFRQAMGDESVKLDVGPTDVRYWEEFAKKGAVAFEPPK
jgi:microcin C transport system substrate-binding protein